MSTPIVQLEDLSLWKSKKKLLNINQLSIHEGDLIGVIGPNGAGKSTLLKLISFLEAPTNGTIYYKGKLVTKQIHINLRREISFVFQQPLMLNTTVFQNVAISLKLRKINKNEIKEKVLYWLKEFGIEHLKDRNAKTLSGGEMQRVAIARAMITNPKVLLLDEPFSALDFPTRKKLLADFKRILANTGITTLFVSHDFNEIKYLCKEFIILHYGEILERTNFEELDSIKNKLPKEIQSLFEDLIID